MSPGSRRSGKAVAATSRYDQEIMAKLPKGVSVDLLANHPGLIRPIGEMRWLEFGHGSKDPAAFVEITARESGRETLPVTFVAIDATGQAVGAVGWGEFDGDLNPSEHRNRSPWMFGTVVGRQSRRQGVGRLLLSHAEQWAGDQHYNQVWVATGDEAIGFYLRCGWQDIERLRPAAIPDIPTTILTKHL